MKKVLINIKFFYKDVNFKYIIFLFTFILINSCTHESNELLSEETEHKLNYNNFQSTHKGMTTGLYYEILNSEDQFEIYNSLNDREKSIVWQEKLDDFVIQSDLSEEQIDLITEIKSKLTLEFFENIEENFNSEEIRGLEVQAGLQFGTPTAMALFYSMENNYVTQSSGTSKCFWCNNLLVSVDGPCEWQSFNGVWQYVEPVTIAKVRFWITMQEFTSVQPCSQ